MTTLTMTETLAKTGAAKPNAALIADYFLEDEEQLHHPILRRFDFMWRSQAQDGRLPGRQHIDHEDLTELLPHLMMLEVIGTDVGVRFRVRLAGQHHVVMSGRNAAGQFLDEAGHGGRLGCVDEAAVLDIISTRTPLYVRYRLSVADGRTVDCDAVLYPMASDGWNVDRVAAIVVPSYPRPARRIRLPSWF